MKKANNCSLRLLFIIILISPQYVTCQEDTIRQSDTLHQQEQKQNQKTFFDDGENHSVIKASLYSILPGLGQAYNRKWWKIPIIYGGMTATTYFLIDNQIKQKRYKTYVQNRIDNPSYQFPEGLDSLGALQLKRQYANRRDLFIFITGGIYLLNIIDAAVDAQLFNYDVGRDLSLKWSPLFKNRAWCLGFQLKFNDRSNRNVVKRQDFNY